MSNIVIKLIISEKADPELHLLLSAIYPRRRAERIRQLAFDGLGGKTATPLKIEKPMEEKKEIVEIAELVMDEKSNQNESIYNQEINMLSEDLEDTF